MHQCRWRGNHIPLPLLFSVLVLCDINLPFNRGRADAFSLPTGALPAHCQRDAEGGRRGPSAALCMMKSGWDLSGLDWDILWDATAGLCRTEVGKRALLRGSHFSSTRPVAMWHDVIGELLFLDAAGLPLHGVDDIRDDLHRCTIGGQITYPGLRRVYSSVNALNALSASLGPSGEFSKCPTLARLWASADPPRGVVDLLLSSFDRTSGELSEQAFPSLLPLRMAAEAEVLEGGGSCEAMRKLMEEENRIASTFSRPLARFAASLTHSVCAAARLDLANARCELARRTGGVRVKVRTEGAIHVVRMRHPLLEMWGGNGVANEGSIGVDGIATCAVISGPNGGGKTVFLKAMGLAAALVAHGCWAPCERGGRIDLFGYIGVTIGNGQDVESDLSTFSSHLASLSTHSEAAGGLGSGCLLLLDELCAGTDPRQGSALAEACLVHFADSGARVIATTHYNGVKALPAKDGRFKAASFALASGKDGSTCPTFRVRWGVGGDSEALKAADRCRMNPEIVERARGLLGKEARLIELMGVVSALRAREEVAREEAIALSKRCEESVKRTLEVRWAAWGGARRLERIGFQRVHTQMMGAFALAEKVTSDCLAREEAAWGIGGKSGLSEADLWDYYGASAEDR